MTLTFFVFSSQFFFVLVQDFYFFKLYYYFTSKGTHQLLWLDLSCWSFAISSFLLKHINMFIREVKPARTFSSGLCSSRCCGHVNVLNSYRVWRNEAPGGASTCYLSSETWLYNEGSVGITLTSTSCVSNRNMTGPGKRPNQKYDGTWTKDRYQVCSGTGTWTGTESKTGTMINKGTRTCKKKEKHRNCIDTFFLKLQHYNKI